MTSSQILQLEADFQHLEVDFCADLEADNLKAGPCFEADFCADLALAVALEAAHEAVS